MIQAVIFDFDGLILDTETPEYESFQAMFKDHGMELTGENASGRTARHLTLITIWSSCSASPLTGKRQEAPAKSVMPSG
jgi:beta-phosphoglucomutase-like phosphatase (HAD superfamily)